MTIVDTITVVLFIIDYLLRWLTADIKKGSLSGLLKYPFTFMAIIDLLSILPSLTLLNSSFKLLKIFRLLRSFRMLRIFKLARYSKSINLIKESIKKADFTQLEKAFVMLLFYFGLRRGEALALTRADIDLKKESYQ